MGCLKLIGWKGFYLQFYDICGKKISHSSFGAAKMYPGESIPQFFELKFNEEGKSDVIFCLLVLQSS
jgi:hypothetical protein